MSAFNEVDAALSHHLKLFEVVLHITEHRRATVLVEANSKDEAREQACFADFDEAELVESDIEPGEAEPLSDILEEGRDESDE